MLYNGVLVEELSGKCGYKCELSHLSIDISEVCTINRIICEGFCSALDLRKVTSRDVVVALDSADNFSYFRFSLHHRTAFWFTHTVRHISENFSSH